jgi:hypothetical protein
MSRSECLPGREDPGHLFACADCRADARIDAAWRSMPSPETGEVPVPIGERFVENVLASVRRDRARRSRHRFWLAAAAAALFFFFAGLAHERVAGAVEPTVEESYASLASPNPLAELIPN